MNRNLSVERRRKILDAAKERFAKFGYEQTQMEHMAKSLGISNGLVYHYFKSKAELFDEVIGEMFEDGLSSVMDIVSDPQSNPVEKLEAMFSAYKQHPFDMSPLITSVYAIEESQEILGCIAKVKLDALFALFEKLIIDGCDSGHFNCPYPTQATYFIIYGEMGIKARHSGSMNELVDALKEMYWRVLGIAG